MYIMHVTSQARVGRPTKYRHAYIIPYSEVFMYLLFVPQSRERFAVRLTEPRKIFSVVALIFLISVSIFLLPTISPSRVMGTLTYESKF